MQKKIENLKKIKNEKNVINQKCKELIGKNKEIENKILKVNEEKKKLYE